MLNKHNLNVVQFTNDDSQRYSLDCIQVTKDATVATNGHYLAWVSMPDTKVVNFPKLTNVAEPTDDFSPFLLHRDAAMKIAKSIPKHKTIEVLNHAVVSQETVNGEVKTTLSTTDLEYTANYPFTKVSGTFPEYSKQIPNISDAKFQITLNATHLAQIAKAFQGFSGGYTPDVLVSFFADDKPIRFDADNSNTHQAMTVILMPMRGEKDVVGSYGYAERKAARDAAEAEALKAESAESVPVETTP